MACLQTGEPRVRFYQLAGSPLESALIGILFKIVKQGLRACLLAVDVEQARRLDELLWRQPVDRFLPHGLWSGSDFQRQPVLIALEPDDRNGASVLLLATPRLIDKPEQFDLVIDFVSSQEPVTTVRNRYRRYQEQGCVMEYWVQSPDGRWSQQERGGQGRKPG